MDPPNEKFRLIEESAMRSGPPEGGAARRWYFHYLNPGNASGTFPAGVDGDRPSVASGIRWRIAQRSLTKEKEILKPRED
jgi:hypothetical protein